MNSRFMLGWALITPAVTGLAAEMTHGEALYQEHCIACHDQNVYTRPNHKIQSLTALKAQVQRCEQAKSLQWFDDDVDAVVDYLNLNYYHFKPTK